MYMEWYIIGTLFIAACAYFSYRSGHKQGVMEGMESTLVILEHGKYIRTAIDGNGQVQIYRVPDAQAENES